MLEKTSENDNPVYWSQGNLQGCSWLILVKGSGGASEERELVRGLTFSSSIKPFHINSGMWQVLKSMPQSTSFLTSGSCYPEMSLKELKLQTKASLTKRSNRLITFISWREMTRGKWPWFYILCVINGGEPPKGTRASERLLKIDLCKSMSAAGWLWERTWDQLGTKFKGFWWAWFLLRCSWWRWSNWYCPLNLKIYLDNWNYFACLTEVSVEATVTEYFGRFSCCNENVKCFEDSNAKILHAGVFDTLQQLRIEG